MSDTISVRSSVILQNRWQSESSHSRVAPAHKAASEIGMVYRNELTVIRATGDHADEVDDLLGGRYDIALLTYEKFTALVLAQRGATPQRPALSETSRCRSGTRSAIRSRLRPRPSRRSGLSSEENTLRRVRVPVLGTGRAHGSTHMSQTSGRTTAGAPASPTQRQRTRAAPHRCSSE